MSATPPGNPPARLRRFALLSQFSLSQSLGLLKFDKYRIDHTSNRLKTDVLYVAVTSQICQDAAPQRWESKPVRDLRHLFYLRSLLSRFAKARLFAILSVKLNADVLLWPVSNCMRKAFRLGTWEPISTLTDVARFAVALGHIFAGDSLMESAANSPNWASNLTAPAIRFAGIIHSRESTSCLELHLSMATQGRRTISRLRQFRKLTQEPLRNWPTLIVMKRTSTGTKLVQRLR